LNAGDFFLERRGNFSTHRGFELYLKTLKVWVGPFSRRDVMIIIAALYVFTGQLAFFLYFLFQLPQQSCF